MLKIIMYNSYKNEYIIFKHNLTVVVQILPLSFEYHVRYSHIYILYSSNFTISQIMSGFSQYAFFRILVRPRQVLSGSILSGNRMIHIITFLLFSSICYRFLTKSSKNSSQVSLQFFRFVPFQTSSLELIIPFPTILDFILPEAIITTDFFGYYPTSVAVKCELYIFKGNSWHPP